MDESKQLESPLKCGCLKILIVDDNTFNLYALEKLLNSYQYKVEKAESGFAAIEKVQFKLKAECCKFYPLIFMDIDMPTKDGYQTCKEIQEILPESM